MKNVPAPLQAKLEERVVRPATCAIIILRSGVVKRVTSHDKDIMVSGQTPSVVNGIYKARIGYNVSAFNAKGDGSVDSLQIVALLNDPDVTEDQLRAGAYDRAQVYFFLLCWDDPAAGILRLPRGWLGDVQVLRQQTVLEFRSLKQILQRRIGRTHKAACDADLGDSRCQVDLGPFTVSGTVGGVTHRGKFSGSTPGMGADWFKFGNLIWTSGANTGYTMEVKNFSGGEFELFLPMPFKIESGDGYDVYAGCDKLFTTCVEKFNNGVNNQSFPHIPGIDKMLRTPDI